MYHINLFGLYLSFHIIHMGSALLHDLTLYASLYPQLFLCHRNMVPGYSSWHVTFYNLFGSSSWSIYTLYYRCHFFSDEVTRGNNILSCQSDHQFLLNNFHWRFFLYNCPWLNNLLHWRISLVFLHWRISPVFLHWRISPLKNFSTEEFSPVKNLLTIYYSISG